MRAFLNIWVFLFLVQTAQVSAKQTDKTEEAKIQYLLDFIKNSDLKFIRNNEEYDGKDAARHLEMKLSKAGSRIKSANDFIDLIASKSSITGKPYQVILKNGSVINLRDLLYHELKKLNKKSQ